MERSNGLLLTVVVTSANVQDREAAKAVFIEALDDAPNLELVWADQGYQGKLEDSVPIVCSWQLVIVKRNYCSCCPDVRGLSKCRDTKVKVSGASALATS